MTTDCRAGWPDDSLSRQTVTNRNKPLAVGAGFGSDPAATDFWERLHRRTVDRIAWPWARYWLGCHARLEPTTDAGWPALLLRLTEAAPPAASADLLRRHYSDALAAGCKTGPLADLAGSLIVVEVGR